MRKKKEKIIIDPIEEIVQMKECLSQKDLYFLTLLKEKKKVKDLEIEVMKRELEIKRLTLIIEELKIQKIRENNDKFAREIEDKKKSSEDVLNEYKQHIEKLTIEYNIPEQWAYDEYSGKIVLLSKINNS